MGLPQGSLRPTQRISKSGNLTKPFNIVKPKPIGTFVESLEEKMAHLQRTVDDLSDIIARQEGELSQLMARVEMLMRREAEREAENPGGVIIGDERPPHW